MGIYNFVSFTGIFILLGVAWVLSSDRRNMNWRLIGWAIGLQLLLAGFIFKVPAGTKVFLVVNDVVVKILDSAGEGAR
ncbi:MAG: nucleoside transporter, partial [Planctomycetaceae bacterium]